MGSLLCFPKSSLPKPVLQPSEPTVELMECPDIQEHILNVVLRCARRETTSKARCIAIASLGQWILQNLTNPSFAPKTSPVTVPNRTKNQATPTSVINPRLKEAIQVILQALQFKHRTIARVAAETLKLCAEKGKQISRIERLPYLIINSICSKFVHRSSMARTTKKMFFFSFHPQLHWKFKMFNIPKIVIR